MFIIPLPSMEERLCTGSEGEELELLCLIIPGLLVVVVLMFDPPIDALSRLYSNTPGMKLLRFASKFGSSSILCEFVVSVILIRCFVA